MPAVSIGRTNRSGREQAVSAVAWFLTGTAIGVTAGMLLAPRSGRDTRRYLSNKTQQGREAVTQTGSDLVDAGRDVFERGRKLVEDAADLFERGRRLVRG